MTRKRILTQLYPQHETEEIMMTRVHDASLIGFSGWGNLIACASDPRKREHTVYLGKANMFIDTAAA